MTISGNQLLSALGSGILPGGAERPGTKNPNAPSFEEILSRVQRGEPSQIGIELGKGVETDSFDARTKERVGLATDLAAIKGIRRAVVDLGDSFVRVDVMSRVLEAQIDPQQGEVVEQIDGFVSMRSPTDDESTETAANFTPPPIPARVVRNASLAALLSSGDP